MPIKYVAQINIFRELAILYKKSPRKNLATILVINN